MLVHATLGGDTTAFSVLVQRYTPPLFNATYRITHSREDACDATQAAFLRAFQKLHTFDFSHRFFSWLYRIALNEALDLVGRRRHDSELDDDIPVPAPDPESEAEEAEQGRLVQQALMELPLETRAILVLRHFQGLSYVDIGDVLQIPEKTVKSRLFTARQRLREVMTGHGWLQ